MTMISLNLVEKPPIPPADPSEADAESATTSGWRVTFAIFAWVMTGVLLIIDLVVTIGWIASGFLGPMSEGRPQLPPGFVAAIVGMKLGVFLILALAVFAVLRMVRKPRAMAGAWVVTGAAFCFLLTTIFLIFGGADLFFGP